MLTKSLAYVKKTFSKRHELLALMQQINEADDVLVITKKDNSVSVSGHTESEAMNLFMLGTAIGLGYGRAKQIEPNLDVNTYVQQPVNVALNHIYKE